jgi:UDP-glucose:(heptosyl)LPS alpha-1,3-glucosyltransferase
MSSKKLLILKSCFQKLGGLEKHAIKTAEAFANRGYSVKILTSGKKTPITTHSNIELHYFDKGYGPNFMRIDQFDRYCSYWQEKYPVPIIFGMDRNTKQTHIRAGNGAHIAYLHRRQKIESPLKKMSFSINPLHRKILDIEKKSFEDPSLERLITNSHMVKEEILSYYNVDEKKISVIHNGVEWEDMKEDFALWCDAKKEFATTLKLDTSIYHFLFIGSGFKRKGLKQILKALSLLKTRNFHLSVVGYDKNTTTYRRLAKKLKISNLVTFYGLRSDVKKFYQMCDCLIIPSFYDPFANVTIEALAMGLNVITSRYNGGKEIISTDLHGSIIDDIHSIDSFVAAMQEAIKKPKTLKRATEIRNSVSHLDFSNQLDKLVKVVLENKS